MDFTAQEIFDSVKKAHPETLSLEKIGNVSQVDLPAAIKTLRQYIIGIAPSDMLSHDTSGYERVMREMLGPSYRATSYAAFTREESSDAKTTLVEVAQLFGSTLDIERAYQKVGLAERTYDRNAGEMFYIAVTIVDMRVLSS